MRSRLRILEFPLDIVNHAGVKHEAVEAFSQLKKSDQMPSGNEGGDPGTVNYSIPGSEKGGEG